jgi:hypothetical protein
MPGFDGTGPFGQGPMTGRGRGFCVLTNSKESSGQVEGFVGINGRPVGKMNEGFRFPGKVVIDMPFGDGTGPAGLGPMTGRAAGFCAGYPIPGYMNPVASASWMGPALGRAGFYGSGVPAVGPYGVGAYGYGASYGMPYGGYGMPYTAWGNPWRRRGFGFGFGRGFGRGRGWGRGRGRLGFWW